MNTSYYDAMISSDNQHVFPILTSLGLRVPPVLRHTIYQHAYKKNTKKDQSGIIHAFNKSSEIKSQKTIQDTVLIVSRRPSNI